ncbi:hypothetical protein F5X96DRAFT_663348 [Biscogniauxia mediterranea]|nr:hypothetical protein F5X96DRAFT_663348 [Biscogniauxia mediterranea]
MFFLINYQVIVLTTLPTHSLTCSVTLPSNPALCELNPFHYRFPYFFPPCKSSHHMHQHPPLPTSCGRSMEEGSIHQHHPAF